MSLDDNWISVSDRLPEELQNVLICTNQKFITLGYFASTCDWNEWRALGIGVVEVTHWQDLPVAPKEL